MVISLVYVNFSSKKVFFQYKVNEIIYKQGVEICFDQRIKLTAVIRYSIFNTFIYLFILISTNFYCTNIQLGLGNKFHNLEHFLCLSRRMAH